MNKKQLIVAWVILLFVCLSCLLLTTNSYAEFNYYGENEGGFFGGFWDGLKSPITITLNVFWDDINVYNRNNNGFMYNLGFFIMAICLSEIIIPLFILAWAIKIILFIILFISAQLFKH